jgi:two-component system, OmpR family, phosphate regulon response regulator PhoB
MTNVSVPASTRPLIMFVDDDPSLRRQVTSHLAKVGFEVVAVGDGDVALFTLRQRRPDLVCLNLTLPRMSGYEVCEQIRIEPELEGLLVLMTSERASLEACAYSYEAGANAYLSKPYSLDRLAKEVRRLLEPAPDDGTELALRLA